jgi:integrase
MAKYYIDPHLGHLPLSQITVTHVAVWITTLLSSGGRRGGPLSASTVRYARLVLHKALEDAVTTGALLINPVARTQAPHKDLNGMRRRYPAATWSADELRRFLQLVDGHPQAGLFTILATTGMRRSEALALTWGDVNLDRREISIGRALTVTSGIPTRGGTKSGMHRRIAVGEVATDALLDEYDRQLRWAALAGSGWNNAERYVFTDRDGNVYLPARATDRFRSLMSRLPLPRIRLHDLRHTHAVLLLQAGMPVVDVSHRLGHAHPAVTLELYAHALKDPGHALAEAFDRILSDPRWAAGDLLNSRRRHELPLTYPVTDR